MDIIKYKTDQLNVIDNFLPYDQYLSIKRAMANIKFPWTKSAITHEPDVDEFYNIQIIHMFYHDDYVPTRTPGLVSEHFGILLPILKKIHMDHLIRIKANVTFNHGKQVDSSWHVDTGFSGLGMTAIMYFDTNNGYTRFRDQDIKIETIDNRMIIFPNEWHHDGVRTSNAQSRTVINFNWLDYSRIPPERMPEFQGPP